MRPLFLSAFILFGVGLLLSIAAIASGHQIPCGIGEPCPTSPSPSPSPGPGGGADPWATNLWYWAVGALVTAGVLYIVGVMKSLRSYTKAWLLKKERALGEDAPEED